MSPEEASRSTFQEFCRENPYTVVVFVLFVVAGAIGALYLPLGDMAVWRRLVAGAIVGAFFALFPVGARLFD